MSDWHNIGSALVCMTPDDQVVLWAGVNLITLSQSDLNELINWATDGECQVCRTPVNVGELICDECYEQAKSYRVQHMREEAIAKAEGEVRE